MIWRLVLPQLSEPVEMNIYTTPGSVAVSIDGKPFFANELVFETDYPEYFLPYLGRDYKIEVEGVRLYGDLSPELVEWAALHGADVYLNLSIDRVRSRHKAIKFSTLRGVVIELSPDLWVRVERAGHKIYNLTHVAFIYHSPYDKKEKIYVFEKTADLSLRDFYHEFFRPLSYAAQDCYKLELGCVQLVYTGAGFEMRFLRRDAGIRPSRVVVDS